MVCNKIVRLFSKLTNMTIYAFSGLSDDNVFVSVRCKLYGNCNIAQKFVYTFGDKYLYGLRITVIDELLHAPLVCCSSRFNTFFIYLPSCIIFERILVVYYFPYYALFVSVLY